MKLTIKIICCFIIFPFLILIFLELLFEFSYKATSIKHFENQTELKTRANLDNHSGKQPTFFKDLQTNKQKVAIFGGSTAYGYAAPVSFQNYLKSIDTDAYIFHNYATPGHPLVGFQEELIKLVIGYYDIIIIYSGHNEIWAQVYRESRDSQESIIMPDESKVEGKLAFQSLNKRILKIESHLKSIGQKEFNIESNLIQENNLMQFLNFIRDKSRVVSVFIKLWHKIRRDLRKTKKKLPFYFSRPVFTEKDKAKLVSDYESSILNIIKLLKKDQKLIISTILSNDLYPPNLDYVNDRPDQIKDWEKTLKNLLERFETKGQRITEQDLKTLPNGAHKEYLKALSCMGGIIPVSDLELKRSCLDIARKARYLDSLPYRALPGINKFIRTLGDKANNIYIVDPDAYLSATTTQVDYLAFFVDFQHPSSLGHMYIALEISKILYPNKKVHLNFPNGCDDDEIKSSLKTNIRWLKRFIQSSSIDFMHKYYLDKAIEQKSKCDF